MTFLPLSMTSSLLSPHPYLAWPSFPEEKQGSYGYMYGSQGFRRTIVTGPLGNNADIWFTGKDSGSASLGEGQESEF